jgi:hypothetical protein
VTPAQLYARTPKRAAREVGRLKGFYYNHVSPELTEWDALPYEDPGKRVELRFYEDHNVDHRRNWVLASVWLDGRPFMIVQNAGREGDDHAKRFITDAATYVEAARYLKSLCLPQETRDGPTDIVGVDDDLRGLTEFYGSRLGDL